MGYIGRDTPLSFTESAYKQHRGEQTYGESHRFLRVSARSPSIFARDIAMWAVNVSVVISVLFFRETFN